MASILDRLKGAGTGAIRGAQLGGDIGSNFTPVGTIIGTIIGILGGGAAGAFASGDSPEAKAAKDWLFGTPEGMQLYNQFSPEQQQKLHDVLGVSWDQYKNPYEGFEPIRKGAMNEFQQEIVPDIAHRFSASGRNAASSGVLHSQLSQAASGLAEKLAAMKSDYGFKNRDQALRGLKLGFTPQFYSTGQMQAATQGLLNELGSGGDLIGAISQFIKAPKGEGLNSYHKAFGGTLNPQATKNSVDPNMLRKLVSPFSTIKQLQPFSL